ncbi:MAG: rod shape-determining protein MreC [Candidatus Omnitrophica bacterium]|nr:rod shape-determining protein MreC [Candidatus Omnitrophota bacterium]
MRLKWFQNLRPSVQIFVLAALLCVFVLLYLPFSKCVGSLIVSFLSPALSVSENISSNAQDFLAFQNLNEENKRLRGKLDQLTSQLVQLQDIALENERLRGLLSIPQKASYQAQAAIVISKDSSNWTKTVMINKGSVDGICKGATCVFHGSLVGTVIDVTALVSKVALITDFNSKIPAKIVRNREEGIVFGGWWGNSGFCRMKYIQKAEIGDKVITSGLGGIYPKGILIGEVESIAEEQKDKLYKIATVRPALELSNLEEIMVITQE